LICLDAEALKALFEPFGSVTVKRMFGGSGIYAEGLCFAIETDGEVFLKTDALSRADFSAADSAPFTYVAKGKSRPTSYWSLPAIAHDEADELRRWARMGLDAARRAAAARAKPKGKQPSIGQVRDNPFGCHARERGHPVRDSRSSRFPLARE
jgi:DNA transformation protein and related proteins